MVKISFNSILLLILLNYHTCADSWRTVMKVPLSPSSHTEEERDGEKGGGLGGAGEGAGDQEGGCHAPGEGVGADGEVYGEPGGLAVDVEVCVYVCVCLRMGAALQACANLACYVMV